MNDILFALFFLTGLLCGLALVTTTIVFGVLNMPVKDGSPLHVMLDTLGRFTGIGIIGALAVASGHWLAIAAAVASITVLVGGNMFTLALMSILMRYKNGHRVMRELSKHEREQYLKDKAKEFKDEDEDEDDDTEGPKGTGPSTPTMPKPSAPARSAAPQTSKQQTKDYVSLEKLSNQILSDLQSRIIKSSDEFLLFKEYVEVIHNNQRVIYDAVVTDKKDNIVTAIEIKQRRTRYIDDIVKSYTYTFAAANKHPLTYIFVTTKSNKDKTLQASNALRELPNIKGVLTYLCEQSEVEAVDMRDFYKILGR